MINERYDNLLVQDSNTEYGRPMKAFFIENRTNFAFVLDFILFFPHLVHVAIEWPLSAEKTGYCEVSFLIRIEIFEILCSSIQFFLGRNLIFLIPVEVVSKFGSLTP